MPANVTLLAPTPPRPPADVDAHAKRSLTVPMLVASFFIGSAVADLAAGPAPVMALLFPLLLLPILLWRVPRSGVYFLAGAALTIEEFRYQVGPRDGALTSHVPLFVGVLPGGINPAELLMALSLLVVVTQAVLRRERWIHHSPVLVAMGVVMAFVAVYSLIGLARGGQLNPLMWEVRPFAYLIIAYLLAAALITRFDEVRPLLWILVLGAGFKAFYGVAIFISVRHVQPRPEAILAHEESFLLGLYLIATVAMWLFRFRDRIRWAATALFPVVLLANMLNSRRTAWLILIVGLAVVMLVALVRMREHRRAMSAVLVAIAIGSAIYFPLFWSQSGALAQPARAIRSAAAPDSRDESSDTYREIESENLRFYIAQSHSMGVGFGRPIQYFGLVDLTGVASMLAYVPHNGVLYLWWRMGLAGVAAFSILVCQLVISAARLSGSARREVAMVGAIGSAMVFGYVGMGAVDLGFWWFRVAIIMGVLVGVVDGLTRGERRETEQALTAPDQPVVAGELVPVPALSRGVLS